MKSDYAPNENSAPFSFHSDSFKTAFSETAEQFYSKVRIKAKLEYFESEKKYFKHKQPQNVSHGATLTENQSGPTLISVKDKEPKPRGKFQLSDMVFVKQVAFLKSKNAVACYLPSETIIFSMFY